AKSVLLVPIEAVNADTEGDFCYVVENDIIVRKPVTIGITSDEFVEIVEGLSDGDQVIKTLPVGAEEGSKVTIIPETEE
ncbi:MAG: RND transporter, partial [Lachnospiraceae bacterium]|nr:RND transporter [Lachnospiraceae bacterium]